MMVITLFGAARQVVGWLPAASVATPGYPAYYPQNLHWPISGT